jgi:hypothetical protein
MIVNVLRENYFQNVLDFREITVTNFGGVETAECENVLHKPKTLVSNKIVAVGCPLHVVHIATRCGLNQLSVNIVGTVVATHKHF